MTEHSGGHTYPTTMTAVALASSWKRRGDGGCRRGGTPGSQPPLCPLSPTSTVSELLSPSPSPLTSRCLWSEPLAHRHSVYREQRDSNTTVLPSLPTLWLLLPPDAAPQRVSLEQRRRHNGVWTQYKFLPFPCTPGRKNASLYSHNTKASQQLTKASFSTFQNL